MLIFLHNCFYQLSSILDQLEELRASELALRVRVKSLTSELALLRRGLGSLMVYSIHLQWDLKLFTSDAHLFLQQSDSSVSAPQLTS